MSYYIGLDMGTSSLGWAVTDEKYRILRKKGKDLWGVRLFQEANTAAARRVQRTARRRLQRRKARIGYIKELFAEEISKVDASFYQRLDDSKFYEDDKVEGQPFALFADTGYTDKEYYQQFPTIFHLRKHLIESTEPQDVRLVYLAVLNMFKHRGHFLNANVSGEGMKNFSELYQTFSDMADMVLALDFPEYDAWLEGCFTSRECSKSKKAEDILKHYQVNKSKEKEKAIIWKMLCGLKGKPSDIFSGQTWEEEDKKWSISFEDGNFDEALQKAESLLSPEEFEFLLAMKEIYDWSILANLMKGEDGSYPYLSYARVAAYEKHGKDLALLKKLYKSHGDKLYDKMFRIMDNNNYSAYVGSVNSDKEPVRRGSKCDTEVFFKRIKKEVSGFPESEEKDYILEEIEKGTFLPKQLTSSNGVIPNQIHRMELKKILENAETYLEFLSRKDESGLTASERILQMFSFQIPYYIGPVLSPNHSKNVWSVRKEQGRVFPWNFEQKIDVKASAEKFIERMVKQCTYLNGESVLPKQSLLYEKFMTLNELNNLKINGEKIDVSLKQKIFNELLKSEKKISGKKLVDYLKINGHLEPTETPEISGIDGGFTNCRSNYVRFLKIFDTDSLTYEQEKAAEKIIFWSTVYGDSKKFLREKIKENYGDLFTKKQMERILGYRFKDWGRLSKSLLYTEGADKETGEIKTLIARMWDENYNLMELIEGEKFTYKEAIENKTKKLEKSLSEIQYEDLEELYISAPVRRMVWQTILVLKEITGVMGEEPARLFVEMARDAKAEKKRTKSRKQKFVELYKSCKTEEKAWVKEIDSTEESSFRSKKLYLYYTQKGRCMYTGEVINLGKLFEDNLYDIDHIYPRHFVKDDSLENNLVLVKKEINAHKSDSFPLEQNIQRERSNFWRELKNGGFITEEKYRRLTRTTPFSMEEKAAFVNRQMVETRQGAKVIAELFGQTFPDSDIVYVKAGNVSDFRQKFKLVKCRDINDFHHAKDAYLNVVVGNVYHVKFTKNPYHFIKEHEKEPNKNPYHMDKIFDYTVKRNGETAWEINGEKSIAVVKKMFQKNTPLVTKRTFEEQGVLAKQTIYSAKEAKEGSYIPVKTSEGRLQNIHRYGGFTSIKGSFFCLVEHTKKGKRIRSIETIPLYLKQALNTKEKLENYFSNAEEYHYEEPVVLIEKIKMQSLLKVNGFYLYLTGRTGNRLRVSNAVQFIISEEEENYLKAISTAYERKDTEENMEKYSLISKEENNKLYEVLLEKHTQGIYKKRPTSVGELLRDGKEKFQNLSMREQVHVLLQILQLSGNVNNGADLELIGGKGKAGVCTLNKNISDFKECKLIHQSVAGLYEKEIDLLKI